MAGFEFVRVLAGLLAKELGKALRVVTRLVLAVAALAFAGNPAHAVFTALQPQYGTVIDFHSRKPVAGALVVAVWETHDDSHSIRFQGAAWLGETITDAEGGFRFDPKQTVWTDYPVTVLSIGVIAPGYANRVVSRDLLLRRPYEWHAGDPVGLVQPGPWRIVDGRLKQVREAVTDQDRYDDEVSMLDRMLDQAFAPAPAPCDLARRVPATLQYLKEVRVRHRYKATGYDGVGKAMACLDPNQEDRK